MKRMGLFLLLGLLNFIALLGAAARPAAAHPPAQAAQGQIAYVRQGAVMLHDLAGGPDRALTAPGQAQADFGLHWSPDGRQLLYVDQTATGVLLTVATGQTRLLPPGFGYFDWTADGQALTGVIGTAIVRLDPPDYHPTVLTDASEETLPGPVARAAGNAGAIGNMLIADSTVAADNMVYYLRRVVDANGNPVTIVLWRVPATGGTATRVLDLNNAGQICLPEGPWVSGADWLAWGTACSHSTWLDLLNLRTGADITLDEHVGGLARCEGFGGWAHHSTHLALLEYAPCPYPDPDHPAPVQVSLRILDSPTATQTRLVVPLQAGHIGALDWSPDDAWLAYEDQSAVDAPLSISIVSAQGGATQRVIAEGQAPAWRPSGSIPPPGMPVTGAPELDRLGALVAAALLLSALGLYLRRHSDRIA